METTGRRAREKEAKRHQILTAAKTTLSEKGFMEMTVKDIARKAGLSPGALYLYFKGKDEILVTLLLNSIRYLNVRLRQVSDLDGVTPEEKMKHLKSVLNDVSAFDPLIFRKIIHLQSSKTVEKLSSSLVEEMNGVYRQTISALTEIFRKIQAAGNALNASPEHCVDCICSLFLGVSFHAQSQIFSTGNPDSLQQLLDGAFGIFFNGMMGGLSQKMGEKTYE